MIRRWPLVQFPRSCFHCVQYLGHILWRSKMISTAEVMKETTRKLYAWRLEARCRMCIHEIQTGRKCTHKLRVSTPLEFPGTKPLARSTLRWSRSVDVCIVHCATPWSCPHPYSIPGLRFTATRMLRRSRTRLRRSLIAELKVNVKSSFASSSHLDSSTSSSSSEWVQ